MSATKDLTQILIDATIIAAGRTLQGLGLATADIDFDRFTAVARQTLKANVGDIEEEWRLMADARLSEGQLCHALNLQANGYGRMVAEGYLAQ